MPGIQFQTNTGTIFKQTEVHTQTHTLHYTLHVPLERKRRHHNSPWSQQPFTRRKLV